MSNSWPLISRDGQVLLGGLHDSELQCVTRDHGGNIQIAFRATDGSQVTLSISSVAQPVVWSEGLLFPIIVARLSFYAAVGVLPGDVRLEATSRARLERALGSSSFEWVILVEPSLGDTVVIAGSGDREATIGWQRSSASPIEGGAEGKLDPSFTHGF